MPYCSWKGWAVLFTYIGFSLMVGLLLTRTFITTTHSHCLQHWVWGVWEFCGFLSHRLALCSKYWMIQFWLGGLSHTFDWGHVAQWSDVWGKIYHLLCNIIFTWLCLLALCSLIRKFYSELATRYYSHMTVTWHGHMHDSHMTWSHAWQSHDLVTCMTVTCLVQSVLLYLSKLWLCLLLMQQTSGCVWGVQTPGNKTVRVPLSGHPPGWPSVWWGFAAHHDTLARWLGWGVLEAVKGGCSEAGVIHMVYICETDSIWEEAIHSSIITDHEPLWYWWWDR